MSFSAPSSMNSSGSSRPAIPFSASSIPRNIYCLGKYLDYVLRDISSISSTEELPIDSSSSSESSESSSESSLSSSESSSSSSESSSNTLDSSSDSASCSGRGGADSVEGDCCWKLGGGMSSRGVAVTVAVTFVASVAGAQKMLCWVECWSTYCGGGKRGSRPSRLCPAVVVGGRVGEEREGGG
eukprot:scaffold192215_cov63-Attheya_sp.AAC.1